MKSLSNIRTVSFFVETYSGGFEIVLVWVN
jgi:hypothetical protein